MTSNMIAFREYEENVRHNREMERLTGEQQAEAARHNLAYEMETARSNRAGEDIRRQQNVINELYNQGKISEEKRHNEVVEYYSYVRPSTGDIDILLKQSELGINKTHAELFAEQAEYQQQLNAAGAANAEVSLKESQAENQSAQSTKYWGTKIVDKLLNPFRNGAVAYPQGVNILSNWSVLQPQTSGHGRRR